MATAPEFMIHICCCLMSFYGAFYACCFCTVNEYFRTRPVIIKSNHVLQLLWTFLLFLFYLSTRTGVQSSESRKTLAGLSQLGRWEQQHQINGHIHRNQSTNGSNEPSADRHTLTAEFIHFSRTLGWVESCRIFELNHQELWVCLRVWAWKSTKRARVPMLG